jgi:hypothetical protein
VTKVHIQADDIRVGDTIIRTAGNYLNEGVPVLAIEKTGVEVTVNPGSPSEMTGYVWQNLTVERN